MELQTVLLIYTLKVDLLSLTNSFARLKTLHFNYKYSWDTYFQSYLINNWKHKVSLIFDPCSQEAYPHRNRQCQFYMKQFTAIARGLDLVWTVFDPMPCIVFQTMLQEWGSVMNCGFKPANFISLPLKGHTVCCWM